MSEASECSILQNCSETVTCEITRQRYTESRFRNHCCREKVIGIEYCFVALLIQHATRMRRITLSPLTSPSLQKFLHIIS